MPKIDTPAAARKQALAKQAKEQRHALAQRERLIGKMSTQAGLDHLGIATLQEIFLWVKANTPHPLLDQLPCPAGGHHHIEHNVASNTVRCVQCDAVLMTIPPPAAV